MASPFPPVLVRMCIVCEAPCFLFFKSPGVSTLNRILQLSENHGDREVFLEVMASLENATHESALVKVSEIFLRCKKVKA